MKSKFFIFFGNLNSFYNSSLTFLINFLSVFCIGLAIVSMVSTLAILTGYEKEVKKKLLSVDPHILIYRYNYEKIIIGDDIVNDLFSIENIISVSPFIYGQVFLRSCDAISGAVIKGVDFNKCDKMEKILISDYAKKNLLKLKSFGKKHEKDLYHIVLGIILAEKLKVSCGDHLDVIYSIDKEKSLVIPVKIVGFIKTGIYQYDESLTYMSIFDMQKKFDTTKMINGFDVDVKKIYEVVSISKEIKKILGSDYFIKDWTKFNEKIFFILKMQRIGIIIFYFLIIGISSVSIMSSIYMFFLNKILDIGILKSIGLNNFYIGIIFLLRSSILIFLGILFSIIFLLLSVYIVKFCGLNSFFNLYYFFDAISIKISFENFIESSIFTFIIAFLVNFYPIYKISNLSPIEIVFKK